MFTLASLPHVSHWTRAKSLLDVFQIRVLLYTLLVKDKYRAHVHCDSFLLTHFEHHASETAFEISSVNESLL